MPVAALDNWQPVWNAQVSISTPVCVNFELRPGAGDIHICWFNFDALAQGNAYKPTKEPINYRTYIHTYIYIYIYIYDLPATMSSKAFLTKSSKWSIMKRILGSMLTTIYVLTNILTPFATKPTLCLRRWDEPSNTSIRKLVSHCIKLLFGLTWITPARYTAHSK